MTEPRPLDDLLREAVVRVTFELPRLLEADAPESEYLVWDALRATLGLWLAYYGSATPPDPET